MIFRNEALPPNSILVRLFKDESDEDWPLDYFTTAIIVPVDSTTCEIKGLVVGGDRPSSYDREIGKTLHDACLAAGFSKMRYHRKKHGKDYTTTIKL